MPIIILPLDLSSQISSGEIIERPSSVVKEIIENSIDADAKNIDIIVEKSGLQSIVLQDDGSGIEKKDLLLAIAHHATSKINTLSDLNSISTFGFRGEALASIRAVSRLTLISCTKLNKIGWKIYSEGFINNNLIPEPIAHPLGTTIIVENLFYNMPVRIKFIKSTRLEFLKIFDVFKKISLAHFNINFSLKHNKKFFVKYHAIDRESNKIDRLKDILNTIDINQLIEVKIKKHDMFLFGWISYPRDVKYLKNIQYCYVNKRFIHSTIFINAIRDAYREIVGNINILFVLYLKIPSKDIDINIHPSKYEIKFRQPHLIYSFIRKVILDHLKKLKRNYLQSILPKTRLNILKNTKYSNLDLFRYEFLESSFSLKKNILQDIKEDNGFNFNNYLQLENVLSIKLLIIIDKYYGLIYYSNNFALISFPLVDAIVRKKKLQISIKKKCYLGVF